MENYLRPCEQKLFTQIEEKYRLMKEKGIIVIDYELEKCQPNGWYPRVRESEKTKYCSDEQGELIENFEVSKNEAEYMNCSKCFYFKKKIHDMKFYILLLLKIVLVLGSFLWKIMH